MVNDEVKAPETWSGRAWTDHQEVWRARSDYWCTTLPRTTYATQGKIVKKKYLAVWESKVVRTDRR